MALEIDRSPQAAEDVDSLWLHVAQDNLSAADRLVARIYAAEDRLAEFPEMGRACPELADGMRQWPVLDYLIFYRIEADRLSIVRILHGARDLPAQFDDAG